MLDVVVAVSAGLLVAVGVMIMLGPALPRQFWARLRGRPLRARTRRRKAVVSGAADPSLNATTQKAVVLAARIATLLRARGREAHTVELKTAVHRVRADEAAGLYALLAASRELRYLSLEQADADRELQRLLAELRQAVRDRAEQLELLPFG